MKAKTLKNAEEFVRFAYPAIVEWALLHNYSIPSVTIFMEYKVKFIDAEHFPSTYNGEPSKATGQFSSADKEILVATARAHMSVISTLMHEYAHLVQKFNLGKNWGPAYTNEAMLVPHKDNRFENEARSMVTVFINFGNRPENYNKFCSFNFKLYTPGPKKSNRKKIPRPTPPGSNKRMRHHRYYDECEGFGHYSRYYYEESTHWSDTKKFACNKHAWWRR
jgi:hypothetical protein